MLSAIPRLRWILLRLFRLVLRRPRLVLAISAALIVLAALQLRSLKTLLDFNDLVDSSSSAVGNFRELQRLFKPGHSLLVVLSRRDGKELTAPEICRIDQWIRSEHIQNPEIEAVTTPFEMRRPVAQDGKLWYLPWLGTKCDETTSVAPLVSSPWRGIFVAPSGSDLLVEFHLRSSPVPTRFGSFDPRVVGTVEQHLKRDFEGTNLRWQLTGRAGFQWYQYLGMEHDNLLNAGLLALVLICFRLFFGSWRGGFLLAGTLLAMGMTLFGLMGFFGAPIDLISNSLFSIVTISVLEDFFFLSYRQLVAPSERWTTTYRRFLVPGLLTSLTTVIGFGSLCFGSLPIVQRLGLWASVGTLLEWASTFILLPALLKIWPSQQVWVNPKKALGIKLIQKVSSRSLPRWAVLLCLALIPLGVWGAFSLPVSDDAKNIFPVGHPFRSSLDYLQETRGWEADGSLIFSPKMKREQAERLIRDVRAIPQVAMVQSPWEVMDSLTTHLTPSLAAMVRSDLEIAPFYKKYFAESGEALATVYMKRGDLESYARLRKTVETHCLQRECFLAGPMTTYEELTHNVVPTLLESCAVSLVLVSLFLALLCRALNQRRAVPVIVSSLWGSFVMLGLLGVFQVQVNYLTCIFASVLVGIAGDNAINYLLASKKNSLGKGVASLGGASLVITLTTMVATSVLYATVFVPPKTLATLFISGLLLNVFGDLWLLKGLMDFSCVSFKRPLKR